MATTVKKKSGLLTLGWQVNTALAPIYWLDAGRKPGRQKDTDLVLIPAETMGYHTAIIAQSGSGKSFFLGRLIEEILLQTKARCLILDPNADFRKFSEPVLDSNWKNAAYNHRSGKGLLPHEPRQKTFADRWSKIKKRLWVGPLLSQAGAEQLRVAWGAVSVAFLAEEADPMLRTDIYHCHEFVKVIAKLAIQKYGSEQRGADARKQVGRIDLLDEARRILGEIRKASDRRQVLLDEFDSSSMPLPGAEIRRASFLLSLSNITRRAWRVLFLDRWVDQATAAVDFVSPEAERYYFGKAKEYAAQRIVETDVTQLVSRKAETAQVEIVDIPSFSDIKTAYLALYSVLETEWQRARASWEEAVNKAKESDTRVPTFIVVDEAHNLMPLEPRGLAAETLREKFRTIAAEGRKYGLFLILCTQRPDKIDPFIISECENRAIMKLGSRSVLKATEELLGLEDVPDAILGKTLEFDVGRVLLVGQWAKARPQFLYTAMRRTVEGGRSLRESYWTNAAAPVSAIAGTNSDSEKKRARNQPTTGEGKKDSNK